MVVYHREKRIYRNGRVYIYEYEVTERCLGLLRIETPFGKRLPAKFIQKRRGGS